MTQMQLVGANVLAMVGVIALFTGLCTVIVLAVEGRRWARWVCIALITGVVSFGVLATLGVLG